MGMIECDSQDKSCTVLFVCVCVCVCVFLCLCEGMKVNALSELLPALKAAAERKRLAGE